MAYKELTLEEFEKIIEELSNNDYWNKWDEWWAIQSPAFHKMFDDAMKQKVKEYCDG